MTPSMTRSSSEPRRNSDLRQPDGRRARGRRRGGAARGDCRDCASGFMSRWSTGAPVLPPETVARSRRSRGRVRRQHGARRPAASSSAHRRAASSPPRSARNSQPSAPPASRSITSTRISHMHVHPTVAGLISHRPRVRAARDADPRGALRAAARRRCRRRRPCAAAAVHALAGLVLPANTEPNE